MNRFATFKTRTYTAVVNSVNLERNIRIVYLVYKTSFALLFSTGIELDARSIVRYYQARFQIEFLFRDAKQFTGLCDGQARSEQALHSHFNASFAALNLMCGTIGSCRSTENRFQSAVGNRDFSMSY